MSETEFMSAAALQLDRLPDWLRVVVPRAPTIGGAPATGGARSATGDAWPPLSAEVAAKYCEKFSLAVAPQEELAKAAKKVSDNDRRLFLIRAVAGGNAVTQMYMRAHFSTGILFNAPLLLQRAALYDDLSKITRWCGNGGRHKRIATADKKTVNRKKDDAKIRTQALKLKGSQVRKKPASGGRREQFKNTKAR
jgi:hypothetical protein